MIKNLNRLSFSAYGVVLQDRLPNRGFPQKSGWAESIQTFDGKSKMLYRLDAERMYLDFIDGMTVLAVSANQVDLEYFYLDKPVYLREGIYFSIFPYQTACSVRTSLPSAGSLTPMRELNVLESFKLSNRLQVRDVYTLFYQEKEKGFFFKGEKHRAVELTYLDKGTLHSVVNGVDYVMQQGETMLYGKNQWHMQYADIDCAVSFVTVTMDLDCSYADLLINRIFPANSAVSALIRQILKEYERNDMFSSDMIISRLQLTLLTMLRSGSTEKQPDKLKTPASLNHENEILSHALHYIAEHVYEKLTVATVAREVNISASYLTAVFHRTMQISPGEYIRRTKLEESKALIREGKMNFTQIAEKLQYSTVHHFSRQFKEKFGLTPTQYAKTVQ